MVRRSASGRRIPLVGTDERVDAHILLRIRVHQEIRHVRLVELCRPVHRDAGPHRVEAAPQLGELEAVVGVLQRLDVRAVPPDHQVGVGTKTANVIRSTDDDVLRLELLQETLGLGDGTLTVLRQGAGRLERRVHRVADGVVDLVDRPGTGSQSLFPTKFSPASLLRYFAGAPPVVRLFLGHGAIVSRALSDRRGG
jgi:hypothetical protein